MTNRPADGDDNAIAEAIIKGLELAGFDPTNMRGDDVVTFFGTAFVMVLGELHFRDHVHAVDVMRRELQTSVIERRKRQ